MSSTVEGYPVIEGFGDAFRQSLPEEYAGFAGTVAAQAEIKGHFEIAGALRKLESGVAFEYLPDEIKDRLSLKLLHTAGLFVNTPGLSQYQMLDKSFAWDSEEEAETRREADTFLDIITDGTAPMTFVEPGMIVQFGTPHSTLIPKVFIYHHEIHGSSDPEYLPYRILEDGTEETLPPSGRIGLRIYRDHRRTKVRR